MPLPTNSNFDVSVQPSPDSSRGAEAPSARADSAGLEIPNNVSNSSSNNSNSYSAGRDTSSYPSNQGGSNSSNGNYNPGTPPGDDQFDPADPTTNIPSDDTLNNETLEAISNSYAAEAFNLIARRGINPIRAEVLGVHEYVPVAKGEDFTVDQSSITLNFGADNPTVVVNQVVRLIELHRTLIQTANLLSEQLISDASGFTKDQIDGGVLIAQYYFKELSSGPQGVPLFFNNVFDTAYPYGNIFDSDIDVILNKFTDAFYVELNKYQSLYLNFLFDNSNASLTQTALDFGFSNINQLDRTVLNIENSNDEFARSIVKLSLINTLIPAIVTYIKEIVSLQSSLNNAINFANLDLQVATDSSDNYSKIISLCMAKSSGEIPQVTSFLDFGTGVSNAAGSNNTINFLNVVSKLYTECMFMRNHTPGDGVGILGINPNHDYVNETITDQVILSSEALNANKIKNGIEKLKRLKPYTSNLYRSGLLYGSSYDIGSSYYSTLNGGSALYDYGNYGASLSTTNVSAILNAVGGGTDQALAELIAAICYDQVVGANVNARSVSSNIRPQGASENNGTGLFPALNILRRSLYKDPDFDSIEVDFYQNYRNITLKESDDNLSGIFSNLTEFAQVAIGLNTDPNNSSGKYIPLDYNNDLTDAKKNAANFTGTVRLGPTVFFLDAVTESDTNLQTLNDFISEFESEFEKVRNFIIDYYSLGFDMSNSDGSHDSDFGSAGKISILLNPMSYFYWYMDLLADELEEAINRANIPTQGGHQQDALLLGLFAESGSSVEKMIRAFKSAYFGILVAKGEYSEGLMNPTLPEADVNKLYQMFCYRTDRALRDLLEGLFQNVGGLRTETTSFRDSEGDTLNDQFTSLLTNNKENLTNSDFSNGTGNERFGFNNSVAYALNSPNFTSLGTRKGAKTNLGSAVGIYDSGRDNSSEDTFARDQFGGFSGQLRGIRPSKNSKYLHHVMRNTPIVDSPAEGGLSNSVSETKFQDHFLSNAHTYTYQADLNQDGVEEDITHLKDRPVANPGQFGGIFSTSSFQRALIFYMWAMRIYRQGVSVNFDLNQSDTLRYNVPKYFARGTIQALKRSSASLVDGHKNSSNPHSNSAVTDAIDEGFNNTSTLMTMVKDAIRVKRHNILQPLAFFEKVIKNLKDFRDSAQDNLNVNVSLNSDPKNYLAGSLIRRAGFLDDGNLVALNNVTAATLHKSLINHFQTPVDSNISKLVSLYDSFAVNDVKLMYKVLSQPGYGLNSNENFGKKDIIHVGIPAGMLTALQSMSFDATNDPAFQSASKIAIHVVKRDEINPDVIFYPRTFVFDMERFILSKGPSGFASNHVANYSDSWSFQDILTNMQVYHSFGGGLGDGRLGSTYSGIGNSNSLDYNMHSNHVFDYYLKMYCRLTTGLDFDEETFKVFSSKLFNGSVDANMQQFFNDYTNNLIQLYPSAIVNSDSAIAFTRALNVSKNYVAFSPFSRLESALAINCFDRVFSIMINERDFTVPLDLLYGASSSDVFFDDPNMYPNGRTQVKPLKLSAAEINIADGQSLFDPNAELSDKLDEYLKGLDPNTTHVSKYSIHISLLKI